MYNRFVFNGRNAVGIRQWLGKATPHKYNLADMQGTRANLVAYPKAG